MNKKDLYRLLEGVDDNKELHFVSRQYQLPENLNDWSSDDSADVAYVEIHELSGEGYVVLNVDHFQ